MISSHEILTYTWNLLDKRMYVIIQDQEAVIIDPHPSDVLIHHLDVTGVKNIFIYLTHEHIDHFIGVSDLRTKYTCHVSASTSSARYLLSDIRNGSYYFSALFTENPDEYLESQKIKPQICVVDDTFENDEIRWWNENEIRFISTPGHTHGSTSILFNQEYLFTGDALLNGIPTITSMPLGSKTEQDKTIEIFRSMSGETIVYPGHGESGRLAELLEQTV